MYNITNNLFKNKVKGVFHMLTLGSTLSNQVDANWQTYIMIAAYFIILLVIGFYAYKQATGNLSEDVI